MAAGDLTTLAAVKAWIGGDTPSGDDAELDALITAYSGWVKQYTSRDFIIGTYDQYKSGNGGCGMQLPAWPITGVTTLEIDGTAITHASNLIASGYRFDDRSIILNDGVFSRGRSNIHIVWTAGYATVPAEIAQAINEMVGLRYKERDRIGFQSKTLAGETVSFMIKAMSDSVKMILDTYSMVAPL